MYVLDHMTILPNQVRMNPQYLAEETDKSISLQGAAAFVNAGLHLEAEISVVNWSSHLQ